MQAWGLFKKMVIADTLSKYVSAVYDMPQNFSGFALVLATLFFSLQIYCDFSGYSDIAIGTAKLLGINLMTNFKSPYFSQSVKEFWSRWHISLSTWFRDYVYIPLGGNRKGKFRKYINTLITFLASGLWHGANWTFVVWGGIHGVTQILEDLVIHNSKQKSTGIVRCIRTLLVFLFASFAWIFFVSNSIGDAFYVISNLFVGIDSPISYFQQGISDIGLRGFFKTTLLTISLIILAGYDYSAINRDVIKAISSRKTIIRWIIYIVFVVWVVMNIPYNNASAEFIYFQF